MGRQLKQAILLVSVVILAAYANSDGGDGATMTRATTTPRVNLQANLGGVANANPTSSTSAGRLRTQQYGQPWAMLRGWQATSTTQVAIDQAVLQRLADIAKTNRNSTAPTDHLSGEEYERVLGLLRAWQTDYAGVASQLNNVGFSSVTPKDIDQFVDSVCAGYFDQAPDYLRPDPSADLRAVPTITNLLAMVETQCSIDAFELDMLTNRLVRPLRRGQLREQLERLGGGPPVASMPPPPGVDAAYDSACGALKDGLEDWLGNKLRLDQDGGFLFALSVGALVRGVCTQVLQRIIERIFGPPSTSSTLPATP